MTFSRNVILVGDALHHLRQLPSASVDLAITSPPYFGLRDYGADGQYGLEPNVNAWVERMCLVFAEVARALKPTGSLWLNLGDSYSAHERFGAPPKCQVLAPERLLLALVGDGWILRNKVIWTKPNAIPTSVKDRFKTTHEYFYFLVRGPRYFFDLDAVREPHRTHRPTAERRPPNLSGVIGPLAAKRDGLSRARLNGIPGHLLGKNPGDTWSIATQSFRGAHFATFPEALVRRPILASCPRGGLVLDPFFGTGTIGVVAEQLGRDWIGIEINPAYAAMAEERLAKARAPDDPRRQLRQAA